MAVKRFNVLILLGIFVAVGVTATVLKDVVREIKAGRNSAPVASQINIGGAFTLVNHDGKTVTPADFSGRFMLVYFGYTYCPDVCPTSLQAMVQAVEQLEPAKRAKVVPILVTVDPERDTPARLKEYVAAFGPNVVGLTGSAEQIAAAAKAYKVYFARVAGGEGAPYVMDHTSIIYVMGPKGTFLHHFSHGATSDAIATTLRTLL